MCMLAVQGRPLRSWLHIDSHSHSKFTPFTKSPRSTRAGQMAWAQSSHLPAGSVERISGQCSIRA